MSERQDIDIVPIGLVLDDGSVKAKGWFCERELKVNKSKSDPKPLTLKDRGLQNRKTEKGGNRQWFTIRKEKSKGDIKPVKVKENKSDKKAQLKTTKVKESIANLGPEKAEKNESDVKSENDKEAERFVESKADLKAETAVESKDDLKPKKVKKSKADLKAEKAKETKADKADLEPKKVKKVKADPKPDTVNDSKAVVNVKVADDKKSDDKPKKDGLITRARQWYTIRKEKHLLKKKERKAAKKAREQEAQTDGPPRLTEEEMWAEILKLESEISSLQDDYEVTEAEWRGLMVSNVKMTKFFEKKKKNRVDAAILEEELGKVMWAQIEMDEKTMSFKQRFQLKMAKMSSRPKTVNAGTQTDGPSTEELYGSFLAYKDKVAKMKTEIVAQTDELEQLERDAEIRCKAENDLIAQTNIDIEALEIKLKQLMAEPEN